MRWGVSSEEGARCLGTKQLTVDGVDGALLVGRVKVGDLLADDERQLDLVVQVHTLWSDNIALAGVKKGGGRLEEEERLLWPDVVELLDVVPMYFTQISTNQHEKLLG